MTNSPNSSQVNLDDLQAFPVLTSEINQIGVQRSIPGSSTSIGQLAEQALRDVLAIRPTTSDPQSFVAALNNTFSLREVDGRTMWHWTPRSFTVQADMGEVTGAQASIHARAKAALDQSVLLLEGLSSLRSDADEEDVDATRMIVRSGLLELVDELGRVGGPRIQRVDALFDSLLGVPLQPANHATKTPALIETDPEKVAGLFGQIRERFGLARARVNTIDEEQNLTNYLILVEHVIALRLSWEARKKFFTGQEGDVFLGTQLVQLGWALGVLAETVHEAEAVMDSVFLGSAERQTLKLRFNDPSLPFADAGEPPLTIAELLGWIERFAREEGPRIIREAGKDGVVSLIATLKRLDKLVGLASKIAHQPSDNPTRGFHTPRVQRSMDELVVHVRRATELAGQVRRSPGPIIKFVEPTTSLRQSGVTLQIFGENFQPGAQVVLELPDPPNAPRQKYIDVQPLFVSEGLLRATFDLSSATPGSWTVVVINADLGEARASDAFVVQLRATPSSPPVAVAVKPTTGRQGQQLSVDVVGVNLSDGDSWNIGAGITVDRIEVLSDRHVRLHLTIAGSAPAGPRDVSVHNSSGIDILGSAFTVVPPPPDSTPKAPLTIQAVEPNHAGPGQKLNVVIRGKGFTNEGYASIFGDDITVNATAFVDETHLMANITVGADAFPGSRDVIVLSSSNEIGWLARGFAVDERPLVSPTIHEVSPDEGKQDQHTVVAISGTQFQPGAQADFGAGINAMTGFVSEQQLMAFIRIAPNAQLGPRDVAVINPDGTRDQKQAAFTVTCAGRRKRSSFQARSVAFLQGQNSVTTLSQNQLESMTEAAVNRDVDTVRVTFDHDVRSAAGQAGQNFRLEHVESGNQLPGMVEAGKQKIITFGDDTPLQLGTYLVIDPDDSVVCEFTITRQ